MLELSLSEQRLLSYARKEFGEFLAQFLLAGLGEEEIRQSCLFTIAVASSEGLIQYRVQAIADEGSSVQASLPYKRDPMVLLALLYLMDHSETVDTHTLYYKTDKLLDLLGWDNTSETQLAAEEAVERYFGLIYRVLMDESELKRQQLSFYSHRECIISQFSTSDYDGDEDQTRRTIHRVEFSKSFIEPLRNKTWLGVDWDSVQSINAIAKSE